MALKIVKTTEEKYNRLPTKEAKTMYLLDNGMLFIDGKLYGADTKIVTAFPSEPIPNIVYINSITMEKQIFINGIWKSLDSAKVNAITNSQIDDICK